MLDCLALLIGKPSRVHGTVAITGPTPDVDEHIDTIIGDWTDMTLVENPGQCARRSDQSDLLVSRINQHAGCMQCMTAAPASVGRDDTLSSLETQLFPHTVLTRRRRSQEVRINTQTLMISRKHTTQDRLSAECQYDLDLTYLTTNVERLLKLRISLP